RTVVDRVLEGAETSRWLAPTDFAIVLRGAGIEVALGERATGDEAGDVADRLGYPLFAKAVVPGLTHSSESGGVILELDSTTAVVEAVRTLQGRTAAIGSTLGAA